jgi:hypothetical protein
VTEWLARCECRSDFAHANIGDDALHEFEALVSHRADLVIEATRLSNRIRGLLTRKPPSWNHMSSPDGGVAHRHCQLGDHFRETKSLQIPSISGNVPSAIDPWSARPSGSRPIND